MGMPLPGDSERWPGYPFARRRGGGDGPALRPHATAIPNVTPRPRWKESAGLIAGLGSANFPLIFVLRVEAMIKSHKTDCLMFHVKLPATTGTSRTA